MDKITSVSRGAFLTGQWTDFQKQQFASEEKIEKKFRQDWKNGTHAYKKAGNQVLHPHIHKESESLPSDLSRRSSRPRQQDIVLGLINADGSRKRTPFYAEDSDDDRFVGSPRANAKLNKTVMDQLRRNKSVGTQKFSKSTAVRGCLDQTTRRLLSSSHLGGSRAAGSRPSSRANVSSRLSTSSSNRGVDQATARAFTIIADRLDNRVGISLSRHRLFLNNSMKKYAKQGSHRISLKQFQICAVNALGCGGGAISISDCTAAFREDCGTVEAINFDKFVEAYMEHVRAGR